MPTGKPMPAETRERLAGETGSRKFSFRASEDLHSAIAAAVEDLDVAKDGSAFVREVVADRLRALGLWRGDGRTGSMIQRGGSDDDQ